MLSSELGRYLQKQSSVLTYNLLEDRRTDDVIKTFVVSLWYPCCRASVQ